ncbi:MAG: ABC transporter permease, partial [Pseudomonadota bacterium]
MAFEWDIGRRYVRPRRGGGFVSFISVISMLGVAIGIAVLVVVLSVVNGFERELTDRLLAMSSHATVEGLDGDLNDWQGRREQALTDSRVEAAAPFIEARALASAGEALSGIVLRGVLPESERDVADVRALMQEGGLDDLVPRGYGIVV